jgi:hypothetical protein
MEIQAESTVYETYIKAVGKTGKKNVYHMAHEDGTDRTLYWICDNPSCSNSGRTIPLDAEQKYEFDDEQLIMHPLKNKKEDK